MGFMMLYGSNDHAVKPLLMTSKTQKQKPDVGGAYSTMLISLWLIYAIHLSFKDTLFVYIKKLDDVI